MTRDKIIAALGVTFAVGSMVCTELAIWHGSYSPSERYGYMAVDLGLHAAALGFIYALVHI